MRYRADQLDHEGHILGTGGQGTVYGPPRPPAGLSGEIAYKQYRPAIPLDVGPLESMVAHMEASPARVRTYLMERLAWPLALVESGGTVRGFLMPRIPRAFTISLQSGSKPQGMQYLLNDAAYLQRIGLAVTRRQLLQLLKDLAELLTVLHENEVAVGDLSPNNVLFTLEGTPRCLLIDCDSMRFRGRSAVPQVETEDWTLPAGEEKATPESDVWKFGRLALRLFNGDLVNLDPKALTSVSAELGRLARLSQGAPGNRPQMKEWIAPLKSVLLSNTASLGRKPVPGRRLLRKEGRRSTKRTVGIVTAVALVLAALTVGVVLEANAHSASGGAPSPAPTIGATASAAGTTASAAGADASAAGATASTATGATGEQAQATVEAGAAGPSAVAVDVSQVAGDPEAAGVAALFSDFFGAVNAHRYAAALDDYDPATKAVDLGSAAAEAAWGQSMSTTTDSDVVVSGISVSGPYTLVTLGFHSQQAPGMGPQSDPQQTCTAWHITYYLTHGGCDCDFRILKAPPSGVSDTGC